MINGTEARKNLYRFLSQMYLMEVDGSMLEQLKKMVFPKEVENEYLAEGYELFSKAVEALSEEDMDTLAADYAKTFLAAGDAHGNAAFPYESVYTGKRRLVGQEARTSAAKEYAEHGLELAKLTYKIPEDHISVEFEFMAYLSENIEVQKKFFKEHIEGWAAMFCADVERTAETDFYKGLAKITRGFLQVEKVFFRNV